MPKTTMTPCAVVDMTKDAASLSLIRLARAVIDVVSRMYRAASARWRRPFSAAAAHKSSRVPQYNVRQLGIRRRRHQ